MISIIDYGMGNLRSVQKAFESVGAQATITQNPQDILKAQKVVLPGVGAMAPAMAKLTELGFVPAIKSVVASGKPFLGICLGLQLMFEESQEGGRVEGLGLLTGSVRKFTSLKVPHMGWNELNFSDKACVLWQGLDADKFVYFCHSYYVVPEEQHVVASLTDYGVNFTSAVHKGNLYGVQFHPEKSQNVGLKILENFVKKI